MKFTALALFLGFATQAYSQVTLNPNVPALLRNSFGIRSVTFNGSGCPIGSGTGFLVQGNILWLRFADAQKAETGPDTSLSAGRRNCSATVRFTDNNKSYAVDSLAYYINADLPAQNNALVNVSWFYEGQGETGTYSNTLNGDYSGVWLNNFDSSENDEIWKPCEADRAFTINSAIRISGPRDQKASAQWDVIGVRLKSRSC